MGAAAAGGSAPPSTQGELYGCGDNTYGQLGNGTTTTISTPVQVGALDTWSDIAPASYIFGTLVTTGAIRADNTLWTWGDASNGMNGRGDLLDVSSPVQVGALTDWSKVNAGRAIFQCIKTDGTLWAWGHNPYGNLGNIGAPVWTSSPVQIGVATDYYSVSCGSYHNLSIKTDGTLWAWGSNNLGQLGTGANTPQKIESPIQIGALTDWAYVAAGTNVSFGVRTDGTLWAWGQNTNGQLGVGDSTSRSSPTQIGALTDWSKVETGPSATEVAHTIGLKTNGTIFTWGNAAFGQLGLGPVPGYKSSPVQVGAATDWSNVYCANRSTFAYNAAGELWATGNNASGMWGLGIAENNYDDLIKIADYPTFTKGSSAISSNLIIR
jgi:alpha-tubulin suppressor-like RCC1 family protein